MVSKNLLFNPGPTNVAEEVRMALITPDMSHRDVEFKEVMTRVNKNLVEVLGGSGTHSSVLFVSSGTGANEAIINGIQGKILAISHGRYSERMCEIAKRYKIPMKQVKVPDLEPLDINRIEAELKDDGRITHIMMVHHETTTGMLDPLKDMGELAKKYNKVLVVDAISSIGSHYFDLQEFNIGFCSLNVNKCMESFPGISFVIAKNSELEKLNGTARSFYFDLYHQWECQQNRKMPYTAAVQVVFAFDVALKRLMREGYRNRVTRYNELCIKMKEGLKKLGFQLIEYPDSNNSNYLTLMHMPKDFDYQKIRSQLKELNNIVIYTDSISLKNKRLFVAVMGDINNRDVDYFLDSLSKVYKKNQINDSLDQRTYVKLR